jgi:hypothetical protein
MVVDLARTDAVHYIQTGSDRFQITTAPTITYAAGITPILAVGSDVDVVFVYNEPVSFANQVISMIHAGDNFYRLVCLGQYDAATNTFVATRIDLALQETTTTS